MLTPQDRARLAELMSVWEDRWPPPGSFLGLRLPGSAQWQAYVWLKPLLETALRCGHISDVADVGRACLMADEGDLKSYEAQLVLEDWGYRLLYYMLQAQRA